MHFICIHSEIIAETGNKQVENLTAVWQWYDTQALDRWFAGFASTSFTTLFVLHLPKASVFDELGSKKQQQQYKKVSSYWTV